MRWEWRLLPAVIVLVFLLHSCRGTVPPQNVLLVTIDTLRADHLGCYGYGSARTPNIDRLAGESVVFDNATTAVPLTLPSHATIMTGVYPPTHGVRDNGGFYLDDRWETLAEFLKSRGFATGGFISAFVLDRRWGIAQGFEEYYDHFELSKFKMVSLDSVQRRGDETLRHALEWIDRNGNRRFFAWVHFYDPHTPYDPPEPFASAFTERPFGLYDGEIAFVDSLIGEMRRHLEERGLLDTTLLVLTADHGESLGDHGETGHGFFIYDATTRVPLIVRAPGFAHRRIAGQVRTIDLYATICGALGLQPPAQVEGSNLVPMMKGKALLHPLTAYSESYYPFYHYGWSELKSLRAAGTKYIEAPEREFYSLVNDSREEANLYHPGEGRVVQMETQLTRMLSRFTAPQMPRPVDDDALEKLEALGYIGTGTTQSAGSPQRALEDPKSKIGLYNRVKKAQWKSAEGKSEEAMAEVTAVLAEDPRILEALLLQGNLSMKARQYREARNSFQKALDVNPQYASAIFSMALAYEREGNRQAATAGFQRLLEIDPRDSKAYFHLGDLALAQKNMQQALTYFRKAVNLDPSQAASHNRLGACYLEMKQYDSAGEEFQKALTLNKRIPNAHFNLGLMYEDRGDSAAAAREYKLELQSYPEAYPAHFNLARIYRAMGKPDDERKELRSCVRQKPDFGVAYLYLAKNLMDGNTDLQEAFAVARQGMAMKDLDPEQTVFGHYLLADILNRFGRYREAEVQARLAEAADARRLSKKAGAAAPGRARHQEQE